MIKRLLFVLFFAVAPVTAHSAIVDVFPTELNLILVPGEMHIEQVSFTFNPLLVRPWEIDVVASDPTALLENLSGVLLNGGGGDTTLFDIKFTGDNIPQIFDLLFIDTFPGSNTELASIPVSISPIPAVPVPAAVWLFGTALVGLVGFSKRRKAA